MQNSYFYDVISLGATPEKIEWLRNIKKTHPCARIAVITETPETVKEFSAFNASCTENEFDICGKKITYNQLI